MESNISNPDDILLVAPPRTLDDKIEGSPYITKDFKPSKINNGNKTQLVRYNAALDIMEIMKNDSDIMLLSKEHNYRIVLQDGSGKVYENHSFEDEGEMKHGYFILSKKISKNLNFYKKENIRFIKGKLAKSSLEQDIPSRFKSEKDSYFLKQEKGEMEKIPSSKNQFLKRFNEKDLKKFISKNNLNFKEEADLIAILTYYYK